MRPREPSDAFAGTSMRRLSPTPVLAIGAVIGYAPLLVLSILSIQIGTSSIRAQVDNRLTSSASLSSHYVAAHMEDVLSVANEPRFADDPSLMRELISAYVKVGNVQGNAHGHDAQVDVDIQESHGACGCGAHPPRRTRKERDCARVALRSATLQVAVEW